MKKHLNTASLVVAIIGFTAAIVLNDLLFAIAFVGALINNFIGLSDGNAD